MGPIDDFFKRAGLDSKPKKKSFMDKHLNVILPIIFIVAVIFGIFILKVIGFVSF